jgi:hypothetical protein
MLHPQRHPLAKDTVIINRQRHIAGASRPVTLIVRARIL